MTNANALIERLFSCSDQELVIGGVPITELVRDYGTPCFVYAGEVIEQKLALVKDMLPHGFKIFYSIKANPNHEILRYFLKHGCGLEVASGGELYQALAAGATPNTIIFAGPGKTENELEMALAAKIGEIHVESLTELARIRRLCTQNGWQASISLRINPSADALGGAMRMGGKASPFGIDEECLDLALKNLLDDPNLNFCGIHLFTGTQILDHNVLITQYHKGLEIGKRAAEISGRPLKTLDFGGGYGIPYFASERELDRQAVKKDLLELFKEYEDDSAFYGTQFVVELGRYLIGEAGIYITSINDIKESRGEKFIIVDGGMHHHLAASGNLGQTIKRNFPLAALTRLKESATEKVNIAGPLCTPLDTIGRSVTLPNVDIGDPIGIFQSGAYARAASPLGFLSHCTPPEIWVDSSGAVLIRRRGRHEDMLGDLLVESRVTA